MKKAFITGINGQDGSYLAELLLEKGYDVTGFIRQTSSTQTQNINQLKQHTRFHLLSGDITDYHSVLSAIKKVTPDEIYNLAAQSHVGLSFAQPVQTFQVNGLGCVNMLEAIKEVNKDIRLYQASTSEMYGNAEYAVFNEDTPFHPASPYAIAKQFAHHAVISYRESYNLYACCGILFNHESPRRGKQFVTRKIAIEVAKIAAGLSDQIVLGNITCNRDWGHARDYVKAMYAMLQQDKPDEFVIGTGVTHSVLDFVRLAFSHVNIDSYSQYVKIDENLKRPNDVYYLCADSRKAQRVLHWKPTYSFEKLVTQMVDYERAQIKKYPSILE